MLDIIAYELMYYITRLKSLIVLVIIILLLMITAVYGEPRNGASFIGICSPKFPCAPALNSLEGSDKSIGYLAGTFGWKCDCMDRAIQRFGQSLYVRVHVVNGTCFPSRGRYCPKGEFFYGLSSQRADELLRKRDPKLLRRYRSLIKLTDRQTTGAGFVRFSTCLECNISNAARRQMLNQLKRVLGNHRGPFVDNPLGYSCLAGTICEKHGISPKFNEGQSCIIDNDGAPLSVDNIRQFQKSSRQCEARFVWLSGFNLLPPRGFKGRDDYVPPRRRPWSTPQWQFERLRQYLRQLS